MSVTGPLSHLDISVGYPARSIAFYDALLTALGFSRTDGFTSEFAGANPTRAGWRLETIGGVTFGIEVRPSRPEDRDLRYDRFKPGPHHMPSTPKPSKRWIGFTPPCSRLVQRCWTLRQTIQAGPDTAKDIMRHSTPIRME